MTLFIFQNLPTKMQTHKLHCALLGLGMSISKSDEEFHAILSPNTAWDPLFFPRDEEEESTAQSHTHIFQTDLGSPRGIFIREWTNKSWVIWIDDGGVNLQKLYGNKMGENEQK